MPSRIGIPRRAADLDGAFLKPLSKYNQIFGGRRLTVSRPQKSLMWCSVSATKDKVKINFLWEFPLPAGPSSG
jgi:hypothetical protein